MAHRRRCLHLWRAAQDARGRRVLRCIHCREEVNPATGKRRKPRP